MYQYTKEEIQLTKFKVLSDEENYDFDSETDYITEYENKFRSVGKSIHRIILEKWGKRYGTWNQIKRRREDF